MRIAVLAATLAAASISAHAAAVVHVGYDDGVPDSNFGAPTANSNSTAYDITTSQTATTFTVDVKMTGTDGSAPGSFANLYFGAYGPDNHLHSLVGFEVLNNDVFIPGVPGSVTGIDAWATVTTSGSVADHTADISFTMPFSFLENDPLNAGFYKAGAGGSFYLTLSQSFGYSVQCGVANFGPDGLGKFTIASAVPEPSMPALLSLGLVVLAFAARRQRAAKA